MRKVEYGESYLRVADPVVDGVVKASSTSVSLPCDAVDGDVLISLDVNGTNVAHRELFKMVEGTVTVGDYTVAYSSGAVTISTTSNNDVVSIRIEPVEVFVSDAFRAAVGEATPPVIVPECKAVVVNFTKKGDTIAADKSVAEIVELMESGAVVVGSLNGGWLYPQWDVSVGDYEVAFYCLLIGDDSLVDIDVYYGVASDGEDDTWYKTNVWDSVNIDYLAEAASVLSTAETNKGKYLRSNPSTGALEWASAEANE